MRIAITFSLMCLLANSSLLGCQDPWGLLSFSSARANADRDSLKIGTYTTPGVGSVNTHWFSTKRGRVLIDAQRTIWEGRMVLTALMADPEPLHAIFLTHPHPDHIGGLNTLSENWPEGGVYASEGTIAEIRDDTTGLQRVARESLEDDFPERVVIPDRVLVPGTRFEMGGVAVETREVQGGESLTTTVFHLPDAEILFCGDILWNRATPFLMEGDTAGMLKGITELANHYAPETVVYPGHGMPAPLSELVAKNSAYLNDIRALVTRELERAPEGELSGSARKRIAREMERRFPDELPVADIPDLMDENIRAVARELAREARSLARSRASGAGSSVP